MNKTTSTGIPRTPLRFAWYYAKKSAKGYYLATLLSIVLATVGIISIEFIFKLLIDELSGEGIGVSPYMIILWFFGVYFFRNIFFRMGGIFGEKGSLLTRTVFHNELHGYILSHSRTFFSNTLSGAIAQYISTIGGSFWAISTQFLYFFPSVLISLIIPIIYGFSQYWGLGALFLTWIVVILFLPLPFIKRIRDLSYNITEQRSVIVGVTNDVISNIDVLSEKNRLHELNTRNNMILRQNTFVLKKNFWSEGMKMLTWTLSSCAIVGVLLVSIHLWKQGILTPGDVVFLNALSANIHKNIKDITRSLDSLTNSYGEMQKALDVLLVPHGMVDVENAKSLTLSEGNIEISNIGFSYPNGSSIFNNLTLDIKAQQKIGLVGKSGAGKSTLIQLLTRSYDLDSGSISIDGQDISQCTMDSLRSQIAFVSQDTSLFHRSVAENIGYGSEASLEKIISAAKLAHAHEFITELPGGYDSLVGDRGVKLSGGQRQRIAIARAILQDLPILVLDEATSALDSESEVAIQKAFENVMKNKTVIVIAHRLSTLAQMDRIVVLDNGSMIEDGTHESLVQQGGIYANLWSTQAGGFIQE